MQQPHRRPLRPAIIVAAVATFAATGAVIAACASADDDQYVHCVDDQGQVVDPDYCDDDGSSGHYWYYASGRHYPVGSYAPSSWKSSRIDPANSSARVKAGLPGTGKIGGTKISSGGFGKGGSGSGGS